MSKYLHGEICVYFATDSVENLAANRQNRFINRYGETDNLLSMSDVVLIRLACFAIFLLRLFNFWIYSFIFCYHIRRWNKAVYNIADITYTTKCYNNKQPASSPLRVSFCHIRQVAPMYIPGHKTFGFLVRREFSPQTAPQAFLQGSRLYTAHTHTGKHTDIHLKHKTRMTTVVASPVKQQQKEHRVF